MTPPRGLLVLVSVTGLLTGFSAPSRAPSSSTAPPAIVTRGTGPTVVLMSGLLGGVARLEPLAQRLLACGFQVVAVDPYSLAADAPDVSFDGLARTVNEALQREGIRSAIVVAHAHASGIALRLAANSPELVTDLLLLDAGVLTSTRSAGIERAMRIAPLISKLPGGNSFIRGRLVAGLRANSGDPGWINDGIAAEYVDPIINELTAVARLATRLSVAAEPESVERMLARVSANLTALVGAAPHSSGPGADELTLLAGIPGARIRRLQGVGHFVHEEAPQAVVAEVLAARTRRMTALR